MCPPCFKTGLLGVGYFFRPLCGHLPQNLGLNLTRLLYWVQKWSPVFFMDSFTSANVVIYGLGGVVFEG